MEKISGLGIIALIALPLAVVFLFSQMFVWNAFMVPVFGLPSLGFWQIVLLNIVIRSFAKA